MRWPGEFNNSSRRSNDRSALQRAQAQLPSSSAGRISAAAARGARDRETDSARRRGPRAAASAAQPRACSGERDRLLRRSQVQGCARSLGLVLAGRILTDSDPFISIAMPHSGRDAGSTVAEITSNSCRASSIRSRSAPTTPLLSSGPPGGCWHTPPLSPGSVPTSRSFPRWRPRSGRMPNP